MISLFKDDKVISVIGMAKNVGKTTTLNYLIKKMYQKKTIGLTSIGRDGEKIDLVTNTPKPQIYIECGTIVATTTKCLQNSDFTQEILNTTGINTPLGEVVIVRALSNGYVDLAGPSYNEQLKKVIHILKNYSVDTVLIDGAISRKGLASYEVSEASILCTGASYSTKMDKVIEDTTHIVNLFNLNMVDTTLNEKYQNYMKCAPISIIFEDQRVEIVKRKTALNEAKNIINYLTVDVSFLLINGALTDEFLTVLFENRHKFKTLKIVVQDATKCLFQHSIFNKLKLINVEILVLKKTKLRCVTYNPTSPTGYCFDTNLFEKGLKQKINLPVYNVMRDNDE